MKKKIFFYTSIFLVAVVIGVLIYFLKDFYCLTCISLDETEQNDDLIEESLQGFLQ